jgi:hypothetical protein
MPGLEELIKGASIKGSLPESLVTIVDFKWIGTVAVESTYKNPAGQLGNELPGREPTLRIERAKTVTVTKNKILTGLNKPEAFILAIVVINGEACQPRYVRTPFQREPDIGVTSVNHDLDELLVRSEDPR